jgi:hypothetical protein
MVGTKECEDEVAGGRSSAIPTKSMTSVWENIRISSFTKHSPEQLLHYDLALSMIKSDLSSFQVSQKTPEVFSNPLLMTTTVKKKVVVAGGNGFLGSRICKAGVARGWDMTSIRYPKPIQSKEKLTFLLTCPQSLWRTLLVRRHILPRSTILVQIRHLGQRRHP